jgi:hypothetical protein
MWIGAAPEFNRAKKALNKDIVRVKPSWIAKSMQLPTERTVGTWSQLTLLSSLRSFPCGLDWIQFGPALLPNAADYTARSNIYRQKPARDSAGERGVLVDFRFRPEHAPSVACVVHKTDV